MASDEEDVVDILANPSHPHAGTFVPSSPSSTSATHHPRTASATSIPQSPKTPLARSGSHISVGTASVTSAASSSSSPTKTVSPSATQFTWSGQVRPLHHSNTVSGSHTSTSANNPFAITSTPSATSASTLHHSNPFADVKGTSTPRNPFAATAAQQPAAQLQPAVAAKTSPAPFATSPASVSTLSAVKPSSSSSASSPLAQQGDLTLGFENPFFAASPSSFTTSSPFHAAAAATASAKHDESLAVTFSPSGGSAAGGGGSTNSTVINNTSMVARVAASHVASFAYAPQEYDEVALRPGDKLAVYVSKADGWLEGCNLTTGETGVFPGNFVTALHQEHASDSMLAQHLQAEELEYAARGRAPSGSSSNGGGEGRSERKSKGSGDKSRHSVRWATPDEIPPLALEDCESFPVRFLGSVFVGEPKGGATIMEAISTVQAARKAQHPPPPKPYEIRVSPIGVFLVELDPDDPSTRKVFKGMSASIKAKPAASTTAASAASPAFPGASTTTTYTSMSQAATQGGVKKGQNITRFVLSHISICSYDPRDHKLFGFVSRQPNGGSSACHVFAYDKSAVAIINAMGRAFKAAALQQY